MQKFVRNILVFSGLILCLLIPAEIYVEHMPNPARFKHEWMKQHSQNVRTLILGSSHTYYGVATDDLGADAFSLALVSQTYQYDLYLLKHYPMPHLKTLILPFSYFSLWEDESNMIPSDIARYRMYMDCDLHSRWGEYGFEFCATSTFFEKLKSLYTPSTETWSEQGWGTNFTYAQRPNPWDNGKERAGKNTYSDSTVVYNNIRCLDEMFSFCKAKGVKVLWITTPTSQSFIENRDKRQVEVNVRERNRLLKKFPEVRYLDFEGDKRFTSQYFYDGDHLNTDGAHLLTSVLSQYCQGE